MTEERACTIAVDLGGGSAKVAWCAEPGKLVGQQVVGVDRLRADGGDVVTGLSRLVARLAVDPPEGMVPGSVGLAAPGVHDEAAGVVRLSYMLGLRDAPIRDRVADGCGLPVRLGHDVGSGAVAEGRLGAARGHQDWLFLALGTGLGAALVLGGRPYRGSSGWGGELAHVVVDPQGPACPCGKYGCLETIASASALEARYRERSGRPPCTARRVTELAAVGDPVAAAVWAQAVRALTTVVAGAVEMLDPSLVVVGGGLVDSRAPLLSTLALGLVEQVRFVGSAPPVVAAQLGRSAGVHGAALIGLELLDRDRTRAIG